MVIPGRGRLSDETDVANYRDMVTIVRDRVRGMIGRRASLDQVKRARPTSDYDGSLRASRGLDGRHVRRGRLSRPEQGAAMNRTVSACLLGGRLRRSCRWRVTCATPGAAQRAACRRSAREGAFIDLTGQWVSVVNEDWRWRMVTPPKGDTASVPLNPAGRKVADAWDLAADRARGGLCKAFGPPGLIRQPGRVRIRWENDNTLLMEFDAGMQTRRLHFGAPRRRRAVAAGSLGGELVPAAAEPRHLRTRRRAAGGSLEVVTTNLQAGYLRPNGVPYSERTVVKEFFDSFTLPDDGTWLIVTTVVDDPEYDAGVRYQLAVQEGIRLVEMESAPVRHPAAACCEVSRSYCRDRHRRLRPLLHKPGQAW